MGIDISSKLIVGLPYEDLIEGMDDEQQDAVNTLIDEGVLDYASPYFDSPRDEWIVGKQVGTGIFVATLNTYMLEAVDEFVDFGFKVTPKVYCSPHVY